MTQVSIRQFGLFYKYLFPKIHKISRKGFEKLKEKAR